jgi:methylation protein EvaC
MLRDRLLDLLDDERRAGREVFGYAATAKSATLLNWCGIGPSRLACIEDTTPAKIGRYTPGTGIPVIEQGERPYPDTRLLLAWNYLGDVLERENGYTMSGGRWIVPIPVPAVI